MKIELNKEIEFVLIPQETNKTSTITIVNMIDNPLSKMVTLYTLEIGALTLWEGQQYDEIGQWTDQDVINAIKERFENY